MGVGIGSSWSFFVLQAIPRSRTAEVVNCPEGGAVHSDTKRRMNLLRALLLAVLVSGCTSSVKGHLRDTFSRPAPVSLPESVAGDIPLTLDQVKQHYPPPAEISVSRRPKLDGWKCHDVDCAVVLPLAAADAVLFADWYNAVTVTQEGKVVFTGSYRTSGEFIEARVRSGERMRMLLVVNMKLLGRRFVAEMGTVPPPEHTGFRDWKSTPLVSQIDLRPDYLRAYASTSDPQQRVELFYEMVGYYSSDAFPLLLERVNDASESQAVRTGLLKKFCASSFLFSDERKTLVQAASKSGIPAMTEAASECRR
jgi:hypothetical protein